MYYYYYDKFVVILNQSIYIFSVRDNKVQSLFLAQMKIIRASSEILGI